MDYEKLAREILGRSGLPLQTVIAQALERTALEGAIEELWVLARERCIGCNYEVPLMQRANGLHHSRKRVSSDLALCLAQPEQVRLAALRARLAELKQ